MEAVIGAGFTSTQTSARSGNSYHERTLDTRLGQLNLKIPKLPRRGPHDSGVERFDQVSGAASRGERLEESLEHANGNSFSHVVSRRRGE